MGYGHTNVAAQLGCFVARDAFGLWYLLIHVIAVRLTGSAFDPCLGAFAAALDQTCNGGEWYTSTKELQLVSLQFCTTCRGATTLTLRVNADIPRRLLAAADAPSRNRKRLCRTRVPRLRVRRVVWKLPTAAELRMPIYALAEAHEMHFRRTFVDSLEGIVWPRRLKVLRVDSCEQLYPMAGVLWPESLQNLTFGGDFNQSMEGAIFPGSLQQLTFGFCFNQSIEGIRWPKGLRRLSFGYGFDQPIEAVMLPDSVTQLAFGYTFDQPIEAVRWPASLQHLTFGFAFDEPIASVVWPPSLQELAFGECFDEPIEGVLWPDSLQQLSFGRDFDQPMERVRWPASLQELSIGTLCDFFSTVPGVRMYSDFDQRIDGARWPASLRRLTLGGGFSRPFRHLRSWMPDLEEFTLLLKDRSKYPDLLRGVEWPIKLRSVTVFNDANLSGFLVPPNAVVLRRVWGQ